MFSTYSSFSSMKSLSGTPKHLWDVQLSTSDKSAATNTELKEMSHRNLNTFTSFNEWMDLKEQKECSKKGPSGNNFCREKKHHKFHWVAVPEQLYSDITLLLQFSTLLPLLHFYRAQQSTRWVLPSNLPKPPCCISYSNHRIHSQAGTAPAHFNYTSLLHTYQPTKQVP